MKLADFRLIAPQIDKEIADVFAKYGFKVQKRTATVNEQDGTIGFKVTVCDKNLKDEQGNATTPEAQRYKAEAKYIGLRPEWLNQPYQHMGRTYTIIGLQSRKKAKPVLVNVEGREGVFVLAARDVRVAHGLPQERSLEELRSAAMGQS